jgi:hypothetical protein
VDQERRSRISGAAVPVAVVATVLTACGPSGATIPTASKASHVSSSTTTEVPRVPGTTGGLAAHWGVLPRHRAVPAEDRARRHRLLHLVNRHTVHYDTSSNPSLGERTEH